MDTSNLQINAGVRAVLARHLVDPKGVELSAIRGVVRLRGSIYHLGRGPSEPFNAETLQAIEQEILRIKNVHRIFFDLDNWTRSADKWVPAPPKKKGEESKGQAI